MVNKIDMSDFPKFELIPNKEFSHVIKFWGGAEKEIRNALKIPRQPGENQGGYMCFKNKEDVEEAQTMMQEVAEQLDTKIIAMYLNEVYTGEDIALDRRTVVYYELSYRGKSYKLDMDMGYGYPKEGAHYMFYDGNYACDCNRSLQILDNDPDFNDGDMLSCGNRIKLTNFKIEFQE